MNRKDFLSVVEDFLRSSDISASNLGIKTLNNPALVFDLRRGRECREKTQQRVLDFIKNYQNKGLKNE